ncbi:hypothetical protein ABZ639_21730 [Saccharomonospora sp. NPDC006951]
MTRDAAARACQEERAEGAIAVLRLAREVETAACDCWTALLAGCDAPARWGLSPRLRRLSEATSLYAGTKWWFAEGSVHRRKVAGAQSHVEDAVADGDGQEFAKAFIGYDNAMACAVVCAQATRRGHRQ